jgi:hypothetical protein
MNSFLALQAQDLAAFDEPRRRAVRERVERELKAAEFVGTVIELFGPVMFDTLNVLGGGKPRREEPELATFREGEDNDPYGGPAFPGPGHLTEPPAR